MKSRFQNILAPKGFPFYHRIPLPLRRYKKRFASIHNQEKIAFILPSTQGHHISVPPGFKVCSSLDDFKVRNIKGGFQRRPELICQRTMPQLGDHFKFDDTCKKMKRAEKHGRIQHELVERSLKLMNIIKFLDTYLYPSEDSFSSENSFPNTDPTEASLCLDIGCGDGYSLKPLVDMGYSCIGVDLDMSGLHKAKCNFLGHNVSSRGETEVSKMNRHKLNPSSGLIGHYPLLTSPADVVRWDLRFGLPFRPNSFDMAISISFLQWLFYGSAVNQLTRFFDGLQTVLRPGGKAVIQFYPQNRKQLDMAIDHASSYFKGVLVGDYPHLDRGRKLFLLVYLPKT